MIALHDVAVHVPPAVPLEDLAEKLNLSTLDVRAFRRLHGLDRIAMDGKATWPELALRAASALTRLNAERERVRYVIAARSVLPASLTAAFPLDDICGELGLGDVTSFIV